MKSAATLFTLVAMAIAAPAPAPAPITPEVRQVITLQSQLP